MILVSALYAITCEFNLNSASANINIMFTPFFVQKLEGANVGIRSNCNGNVKTQHISLSLKGQVITIPSCSWLSRIDIASNVYKGDWKACMKNSFQGDQVVLNVASDLEYTVATT
eukprot:NODE_121_length_18880_cov_0.205687.p11 type:complete len:115 gc:universal NODE_121_length_18880_cov_0.205687:14985-15329(+)